MSFLKHEVLRSPTAVTPHFLFYYIKPRRDVLTVFKSFTSRFIWVHPRIGETPNSIHFEEVCLICLRVEWRRKKAFAFEWFSLCLVCMIGYHAWVFAACVNHFSLLFQAGGVALLMHNSFSNVVCRVKVNCPWEYVVNTGFFANSGV